MQAVTWSSASPKAIEQARAPKFKRCKITQAQLVKLDEAFSVEQFPSFEQRQAIAERLELAPRSVQIWFQNKRQRLLKPRGRLCAAGPRMADPAGDDTLEPLQPVAADPDTVAAILNSGGAAMPSLPHSLLINDFVTSSHHQRLPPGGGVKWAPPEQFPVGISRSARATAPAPAPVSAARPTVNLESKPVPLASLPPSMTSAVSAPSASAPLTYPSFSAVKLETPSSGTEVPSHPPPFGVQPVSERDVMYAAAPEGALPAVAAPPPISRPLDRPLSMMTLSAMSKCSTNSLTDHLSPSGLERTGWSTIGPSGQASHEVPPTDGANPANSARPAPRAQNLPALVARLTSLLMGEGDDVPRVAKEELHQHATLLLPRAAAAGHLNSNMATMLMHVMMQESLAAHNTPAGHVTPPPMHRPMANA